VRTYLNSKCGLSTRFRAGVDVVLLAACLGLLASASAGCKAKFKPSVVGDGGAGDASSSNRDTKRDDAANVGQPDVAVPINCPDKSEPATKGKSESCACDNECRSGFCVNNVCCTTACKDGCKACNLPSSLGDCSFIPAGVRPVDTNFCSASTASTCGQDGTCDGKGDCRKYVAGIECKPGTCDGDAVSGAKACDGNGSCSVNVSTPCAPYSCDPAKNQCAGDCTSNAQCAAGQTCAKQSCGVKLNGSVCAADDECASGHCADKRCCNVACNGACLACDQAGSVGRCKFVDAGLPHAACKTSLPSTCETTGLCDGAGTCSLFPENTPCDAPSCAGSVQLNTARVCDGQGICRSAQLVDCSPYLCTQGGCNGSCLLDSDCEPGHKCVATSVRGLTTGRCGLKKNGQICSYPTECESNQCVDGVCCESACEGACRSCALPGSPGQCANVAAGATDPRQTCKDAGKSSCATNGVCDGTGACQKYPVGTVCGTETCLSGAHSPAGTCNQSGQCVAPPSLTCSPFICNGPSCFTVCSNDKDCVSGSFCINSSCGLKPPGAECTLAKECQSNHCAQGTCCNSDCTGACMACNLSASLGLCTTVADNSPDPQEKCKVTASATCGTTGLCKGGACTYVAKGNKCKDEACSTATSEVLASTCDGLGACVTPAVINCGAFICKNNVCMNTCTSDTDCVSPNTCVNNSCGKKLNGATCSAANQCQSNFCTEGVCCDTACSDGATGGLCKSCKVTGKVGTCSSVPAGSADPKQKCVASNAATGDCSNDGTCNGSGACRPWSTSTGCRQASCPATGSTLTSAANCDGAGHCPAATTQACDPFKCSATSPSCLTTCTVDTDCVSGETCLKTTNACGSKLANGKTCKANTDCQSAICSAEGVCCNNACTGTCQSCTISGSVGTCSNIAVSQPPQAGKTCGTNPPCGTTGACNGSGSCQLTSSGTSCGSPTCAPAVSGTVNGVPGTELLSRLPAPACDGAGTCVPATAISCGQYQCNTSTGACKTSCSSTNSDCYAFADPSGGYSCVVSGNTATCQKLANGAACTTPYACTSGYCVDNACCGVASCNDNLACTTDTCTGSCNHVIAAGSCVIAGVCYASGDPNPANQCQRCTPGTSQTAWTNRASTDTCNDGNACTYGDVCGASATCAGTPYSCDDGLACTADSCNGDNTCNHVVAANQCGIGGIGGGCYASGAVNPANQCQLCTPATSQTGWTSKASNAGCDDGNPCTQNDVCGASATCAGVVYSCPSLACTTDTCNGNGTCSRTVAANQCAIGGVCYAAGVTNPANQCQQCTPGTSQTEWSPKASNVSCNDGNLCTSNDVCGASAACAGTPYSCPSLSCTTDVCKGDGNCDRTILAGNCVIGGTCYSAAATNPTNTCEACTPGTSQTSWTPLDGTGCDDGNLCTTDICVAGTCVGTPIEGCI